MEVWQSYCNNSIGQFFCLTVYKLVVQEVWDKRGVYYSTVSYTHLTLPTIYSV